MFAGVALLASLGLASAQDDSGVVPGVTHNYIFTGFCDGVSFTAANGLLQGTHTGSYVPTGLVDSGAALTTKIAPETAASPAYIVADGLLMNVGLTGFYVIDVKHKKWANYYNNAGTTVLLNKGTLTPGIPPRNLPGLPSTVKKY